MTIKSAHTSNWPTQTKAYDRRSDNVVYDFVG